MAEKGRLASEALEAQVTILATHRVGEGEAPAFLSEKQVTGLLGTGPAAKGKPETMKESLAGWLGQIVQLPTGPANRTLAPEP